jgi:RimJ/RimL family protein N-acetyltransferase
MIKPGSEDLFTGKLIRLTAPRPEDAAIIARWTGDSSYQTRMDTDLAVPKTAPELDRTASRMSNLIDLRVRTLANDELIGFVALFNIEWNNRTAMMAMGIGERTNRKHGFGTEALRLLLQFAFCEANLDRVGLDVISYNEEASRLYEKAGFVREGVMRRCVLRSGQRYDRIMMGLLREEWLARVEASRSTSP